MTSRMPRSLELALMLTDLSFLAYWAVSALMALGMVHVPTSWMYAGYGDPRVAAWNWSFLPLDLAFSALGLLAVRAARRDDPSWRPLALLSLAFTMAAGGMAVAYWTLAGEFDPAWFLPNLCLLIWPLAFVRGLVRPD